MKKFTLFWEDFGKICFLNLATILQNKNNNCQKWRGFLEVKENIIEQLIYLYQSINIVFVKSFTIQRSPKVVLYFYGFSEFYKTLFDISPFTVKQPLQQACTFWRGYSPPLLFVCEENFQFWLWFRSFQGFLS